MQKRKKGERGKKGQNITGQFCNWPVDVAAD